MPLKKCPDCGRDISTRATAYPHCGAPQLTDADKDKLRQMIQQWGSK